MNDVNKNLGHATAYGYAKSKGYTGTEDEFAALMADYAEVGERAEAAATAAAASATAASGSASDSAASATAAAGSSTAASTAAGNASQAAQTATTKASEAAQSATAAAGSATTASTKATEAAQSATAAAASATAAESAKTAAQAAQTAAETAKTAAETAQTAAEDAAESVSASAAQIAQNTADISSVKNALSQVESTQITDTASGAIATFPDGAAGVDMRSVVVQCEPIQSGSGDPSPDNVRPISGRSEVGVWRGGANLIDDTNWGGYSNEVTLGVGTWYAQAFVSGTSNINSRLQYKDNGTWTDIFESSDTSEYMTTSGSYFGWLSANAVMTIVVHKPVNVRFSLTDISDTTRRLSISSTQLFSYVPYQPIASIEVQLGQTVYGGTVDAVSGVMTVDRAMVQLDGRGANYWNKSSKYPGGFYFDIDLFNDYYHITPRKNTPFLCSHAKTVDNISNYVNGTCYCDGSINIRIMSADTTGAQWVEYLAAQNTAGTPIEICCYLAQPVTVQLTAQQLTSILGTNNVWSDGGNVSVDYVADTKAYIAKVIAVALA